MPKLRTERQVISIMKIIGVLLMISGITFILPQLFEIKTWFGLVYIVFGTSLYVNCLAEERKSKEGD